MGTFFNIAVTLVTAAAYFYFNQKYFLLVMKETRMSRMRTGFVNLCFVVNFLSFLLFGVLELHLIVNWLLFAALLFFETLFYEGGDRRCALFHTLVGIIWGLAINIFCRSAIAILLHQPLQVFNNNISATDNFKEIPVLLGFLITGFALQYLSRPPYLERLRLILNHPAHQTFLLELMLGLFCYLFINLLLYSTPLNNTMLKLWSIKSCLFCVIGFHIAVWYTWRICELNDYREKNRQMEQELKARKKEQEDLWQRSNCDALTGLYNRQYADEKLAELMKKGECFALCFVDLDGLKAVNDQHGHDYGDQYLLAAAKALRLSCRRDEDMVFRYGGDEFLVVFEKTTAEAAEKRMENINAFLTAESGKSRYPFPMSVSCGVVNSRDFSDAAALIRAADTKMYGQKQGKKYARCGDVLDKKLGVRE